LVLDIGGTTTDMSVVLDGVPLLDPVGIRLGPYRTLIRSLLTHSIAIGGDSEIRASANGPLKIGPLRQGKPAAFGGPAPTPTDAMIVMGILDAGNAGHALEAMQKVGASLGLDAKAMSRRVLEEMAQTISDSAGAFVHYINSQPVYTIHEALEGKKITPSSAVLIGGPAIQLAKFVGDALELPCRVPPHFGVANAVGAAVARVTTQLTLHADTERGIAFLPEVATEERIDQRFGLNQAIEMAKHFLQERAIMIGADPSSITVSVAEKQVFNMIRGYSRTGQNIRLKMVITPGIIPSWKRSH
jgi:N-methylhydantoinase A/oxoprolinase/acetone carboxylase beta subunit